LSATQSIALERETLAWLDGLGFAVHEESLWLEALMGPISRWLAESPGCYFSFT